MKRKETSKSFHEYLTVLSLLLKAQHQTVANTYAMQIKPHAFVRFIERHNLKLLVFSLLEGSPVRSWLPQEYLRELRRLFLQHWTRQETLVREFMAVVNVFAAAGPKSILLKGIYLANTVFRWIDHRLFI